MKKLIGIMRAMSGVVLFAACGESPTEPPGPEPLPKSEWVHEGNWGDSGFPLGLATAPKGDVYVAVRGDDCVEYLKRTGSFLGRWGFLGSGNGEFKSPCGVVVAPNGDVYVADDEHRIQYFSSTGSFIGTRGLPGEGSRLLIEPYDVPMAPNNRNV
jgi:DNA-binding beta-propeller fold protein YncE